MCARRGRPAREGHKIWYDTERGGASESEKKKEGAQIGGIVVAGGVRLGAPFDLLRGKTLSIARGRRGKAPRMSL